MGGKKEYFKEQNFENKMPLMLKELSQINATRKALGMEMLVINARFCKRCEEIFYSMGRQHRHCNYCREQLRRDVPT